ncbi:MAG: GUN4 domain-containing protein [Cyanobacteria bacterium P01_C01_bin.120]
MIEIEIENGLLELEKLLDASDAQIAQVIEKSKIFRKLEDLLDQADWRTADVVTLGIMLVACQRREAGWLDQTAIAELPCEMLHQIDHRWWTFSKGRFGFNTQLEIYREELERSAFAFSCQVGWTMTTWRPLSFFKFYSWLTFSLDAPRGHLPALWFWEMPSSRSLRAGGFATGRGAAFGNPQLFDALMLRLERCHRI